MWIPATLKAFGKQVGGNPSAVLAPRLGKGSVLLVSVLDTIVNGVFPCQIGRNLCFRGARRAPAGTRGSEPGRLP